MKQSFAIAALFLGIIFDSWQWDNQIMQSPDELTVTEFEQEEHGLSVVLTNAIEDQRAVVEHLVQNHDMLGRRYMTYDRDDRPTIAIEVNRAAEMQFRAMRVLGLLEATREREAGQAT